MDENEDINNTASNFYSFTEVVRYTEWVWKVCRPIDKWFGIVFYLLSLVSNIKGVISIAIYGYIISAIVGFSTQGFNSTSAWMAFGLYAGYSLFDNVLSTLEQRYFSGQKNTLETHLQVTYLQKILRTDFRTLDKNINNETLTKRYGLTSLLFSHYAGSLSLLSNITAFLLLLVIMAYYAWPLVLIIIALSIPRFLTDKTLRKEFTTEKKKNDIVIKRLRTLTTAWFSRPIVHYINMSNIGQLLVHKFLLYKTSYQRSIGRSYSKWQTTNRMLDFANSLASLIGYAWVLFKNTALSSVGSVYFQLRIINLLESKIKGIIAGYNAMEERCEEIADLQQAYSWPEISSNSVPPDSVSSNIEFKAVSFLRPASQTVLLDSFEAVFKVGEKITIISPDPVTKDVISSLFTGQITPNSGEILADQRPSTAVSPGITVISSPASYFPFLTIAENISLKLDNHDDPKISQVLEQVGIGNAVLNFPHKSNQILTELPAPIHPDYTSIILAARVLYHRPNWVLWRSSRDTSVKTESFIFKLLSQTVSSVITLTDKVSSSVFADRVILIEQGKIIEQGTVAELKQSQGKYAKWLEKVQTVS